MSDVEIRVTPDAQEHATANPADDQGKYVGMWVTADGHIRHELLPGGRYDEARGRQKRLSRALLAGRRPHRVCGRYWLYRRRRVSR